MNVNREVRVAGEIFGSHEKTARVLLWLLVIFILMYLPAVAVFSVSIDDENAAYRTDPSIWVAQGRWASYLIELLIFRQSVVPYTPDLILGLGAAGGYILLIRRIAQRLVVFREIILFGIFIGFPVWSFLAQFYSNLSAAGIGLFLTCLAVSTVRPAWRSSDKGIKSTHISGVLIGGGALAVAIACYQSYLFFFASAGLALIILEMKEGEDARSTWRLVRNLIVIGLAGCIIYYALWRLFMRALHVQPVYIQGFISFEALFAQPLEMIRRTFGEVGKIYGGSASAYMQPAYSFGALIILAYIALIHTFRKRGVLRTLLACIALSLLLVVPFSLNPLSYGMVPYRSLVGAAFAAWFSAYIAVQWLPSRFTVVAWIVVAAVLLQSIYTLSLSQAATTLAGDHDRLLALQIHERIDSVDGAEAGGKVKLVEFFGARPFMSVYPKIYSSAAGSSFFEWDGGNPYRIVRFMNLIGYWDIAAVDGTRRVGLLPYLEGMPVWPAKGAVKVVDGVTLVRLGTEPGSVHSGLIDKAPFVPRGADVFYDSTSNGFSDIEANGEFHVSQGKLDVMDRDDPQIVLNLDPRSMRTCRTLQIHLAQDIAKPSTFQVFYSPAANGDFTEKNSQFRAQAQGLNTSNVFISSPNGFGAKIRLDPISGGQKTEIREMKIGCLARVGSDVGHALSAQP